jgi:hypothetical protein
LVAVEIGYTNRAILTVISTTDALSSASVCWWKNQRPPEQVHRSVRSIADASQVLPFPPSVGPPRI